MTLETLVPYEYEIDSKRIEIDTDPVGVQKAGTGATVWDSCIVLAKYFEKARDRYTPKTILELGAGTGLLSIVLATLYPEARVITTDLKAVEPILSLNIQKSGLTNISFKELDWTNPSLLNESIDLLVMSDLITWPELYDPLVTTLESIASPNTVIVFSHESRSFEKEANFYARLSKKFKFQYLKPEDLDERFQCEDIFVFVATRK